MKSLAFYSCFFGGDHNWALVAPRIPSKNHDCFFYTNNKRMVEKLEGSGWKVILLESVPIHNCNILDALESKYFKACPHRLAELKDYTYWCYSDSKHWVNADKVEEYIDVMEANKKLCIFPRHPSDFRSVWDEFHLAIQYPKYKSQESKMKDFIHHSLEKGYNETIEKHYATGFSIRKNDPVIYEMNNLWYSAIMECGIECQVSFSFIQQKYDTYILAIPFLSIYGFM
jgi:hypothetical protein